MTFSYVESDPNLYSQENQLPKPKIHLFEKENHLPNLHYCVSSDFSTKTKR